MVSYFAGEWCSRKPHKAHLNAFLSMGDPLCVYDLGASGGAPPPFCWLLDGISLINFEPNSNAEVEKSGRNCDIAIGPQTMKTLHINRRQTTSSLLPPREDVVNRYDFTKIFPEEPRVFETVSTVEIETLGLDDAVKNFALPSPDFLKIDVQGLTHEVLLTGEKTISKSVLGLQVEVEFVETYTGQKTFGTVHEYLEKQNFEIFRLSNLNRWIYKISMPLMMYTGQDVFCDLLYLRSLHHVECFPEFWTSDRIIQYIRLCLLYDLTDTAGAFLEKFITRKLIDESSAEILAKLIMTWEGALDYFYHPDSKIEVGRRRQFFYASNIMIRSLLPSRVYNNLKSFYHKVLAKDKIKKDK
jgi:FkbM family methyltransferase